MGTMHRNKGTRHINKGTKHSNKEAKGIAIGSPSIEIERLRASKYLDFA